MTPMSENKEQSRISQAEFHELLREKMQASIRLTFSAILEDELEAWCDAKRYERSDRRRDHRIGSRTRDLGTSVGVIEDLEVPRTRHGFQTQLFEKYKRRQAELDEMIGEMFVKGISQAQVGQVLETLNGIKPSASTVSRTYHNLEEEYQAWKQRPLPAHYVYVFADGTYFSVIYGDEGQKTPVLALIGILPNGSKEVIALTIGERENEAAWRNLVDELKTRGVQTVDLWITDGNQAMINAIQTKFPDSQRQRCMVHKLANVLGYVIEKYRAEVETDFKRIFYQDSRVKADQEAAAFREKYRQLFPEAIACMDRDWEACLTFYAFPKQHWIRIRTTNLIERLFLEVKKRSKKMAAPFRNEGSCLLLVYAVVRSIKFQNVAMKSA